MGCYKWFKSVVVLGNTADAMHWTGRLEGRGGYRQLKSVNLTAARSETAFLCRLENWFHKCFMQQRTSYILRPTWNWRSISIWLPTGLQLQHTEGVRHSSDLHDAGFISFHNSDDAEYDLLGCDAVYFLRARFSSGATYFSVLRSIKTGCKAHPASYPRGWCVKLTAFLHPVPKSTVHSRRRDS
jgi:hypothetical protein